MIAARRSRLAFVAALFVTALSVVASPAAASDPRVRLVESQAERDHRRALEAVESLLAQDPEYARRLGLDYLRGHLLLLLDRRPEALRAFATTIGSTPELGPYGRFRLAREQEAQHPEMAAGLVATLLGDAPPKPLIEPSVQLLERTLARGGDCRVLGKLRGEGWSSRAQRRLLLARAGCWERDGKAAGAESLLIELLEKNQQDDVARAAALRLADRPPRAKDPRTHFLLGLSFYSHREFSDAIDHLARALVGRKRSAEISAREAFNGRYALARSRFWQERFDLAAAAFGMLAQEATTPTRRAQVFYQQARSLELYGDLEGAAAAFDNTYRSDSNGRWSDAALIGLMRLRWLAGRETEALDSFATLLAKRKYDTASRALLFLASSDLTRGRGDRAAGWLDRAADMGRVPPQELDYWRGRLEETRRASAAAVGHYLRALRRDPYQPFAVAARERLAGDELATVARASALRLAGAENLDELYAAWLLLGDGHAQGRRARHRIEQRLQSDPAAASFLRLAPEPTADWPLWREPLRRPEEMLLALGLFDEGESMVLRHFPIRQPGLAFTGSMALARAGATNRSLYVAEILAKRVPDRVPAQFLPTDFRRLLYPFRYGYLILRETERRAVDPHLLAAIIREESRFDPDAVSPAAARGLTQFVMPTARRIAEAYSLGPIEPDDLENPETSIVLGAAYLRDLANEFRGSTPQMVAAYNAGEPQAALWRRYCYSDELAEYLTKVSFQETRNYLLKVLTSRAHYQELYPPGERLDGIGP